ncbi:MAG TPA: FRG domain-containing protein, partial [Verrucomicrobiae bacterium]|nr:FRG domain-containing protein [Verrucomicrobiae bacterium]
MNEIILQQANGKFNNQLPVRSVEEFLTAVDQAFAGLCPDIDNCELWFRGQPQASFHLEPRIARKPRNPELEILYLSKFKSMAIPYVQELPSFPIPNGRAAYWHWLVMMQHYGVPTRLMDWSRDALTALFFATTQMENDVGKDAAVWVLNPVTLNTAFSFHSFVKPGYIPNLDEEAVDLYFGPNAQILANKKPAAVIAPLNNPHIVAQRGVFTVFPRVKEIIALDLFPDSANYLVKIVIAADRVDFIHNQLANYGITRIALFPDITEIADEITDQVDREGQLPPTTVQTQTQLPQTQAVLPPPQLNLPAANSFGPAT